ncbi:hypothetical protein GCM10009565_53000 [Amycolatopsis albidoflavus]
MREYTASGGASFGNGRMTGTGGSASSSGSRNSVGTLTGTCPVTDISSPDRPAGPIVRPLESVNA